MGADSTETHGEEQTDEDDREVTPVGQAPKDLLELSTGGEQNTRAYQAPRELLELARRQQAQRIQARAHGALSSAAPPRPALSLPSNAAAQPEPLQAQPEPLQAPPRSPASAEPAPARWLEGEAAPPRPIDESLGPRHQPTHRPARSQQAESSTPSISVAPASSSLEGFDSESSLERAESEPPSDPISVNDAAPAVARSRPSRSLSDEPEGPSAPPASLSELVRAATDPHALPSTAAPSSRRGMPESAAASSRTGPSQRLSLPVLVLIVSICLLIGFVLAKWRGLDWLFPRH